MIRSDSPVINGKSIQATWQGALHLASQMEDVMEVLVLSATWEPLRIVPWQVAISDVLSGRAEVLEDYADRFIRSATKVFNMPAVVRFVAGVVKRMKRGVKFNRTNIWLRDNGECQYCGIKVPKSSFTYDHVIPRARGGKTIWENIVTACKDCNQRKGDRQPEQAGMRLRSKPVRPRTLPGMFNPMSLPNRNVPEAWKFYAGIMD